jgi:hypothetical protein
MLCCDVIYAVLCCVVLCCAVLCCAVLCCIVLYCIVLYCIVLYCIVLCSLLSHCQSGGRVLSLFSGLCLWDALKMAGFQFAPNSTIVVIWIDLVPVVADSHHLDEHNGDFAKAFGVAAPEYMDMARFFLLCVGVCVFVCLPLCVHETERFKPHNTK